MKQMIRMALIGLLGLFLAVGLFRLGTNRQAQCRGAAEYKTAAALAGVSVPEGELSSEPETEPDAAEPESVDLAALRAVNGELAGWLSIPGTAISYPLMQGTDNDYYLSHTWTGEENAVGAIFMDYRSDRGLNDFNTLIYGHRMRNGSMFGSLQNYGDQTFWEQARELYLTDDHGTHRCEIFAAYEAEISADLYWPADDSRAAAVLGFAAERSVIDTGIALTEQDHILTLVTCTGRGYDTRWIVQAVLRESEPE